MKKDKIKPNHLILIVIFTLTAIMCYWSYYPFA
jgi:hypothetical protein